MEKVSLLALVSFGAFGIISLARVALRFVLSRYIVSSYQIHGLRILGARSVWGTKDSWKGPYEIKAMVVISLSHLI
jgi:hypothetical protein